MGNKEQPRWHLPIIGYVQWYLLNGYSPETIRRNLRESVKYPDITDAEWESIYAAGLADCRATLKCRTCCTSTKVSELWI